MKIHGGDFPKTATVKSCVTDLKLAYQNADFFFFFCLIILKIFVQFYFHSLSFWNFVSKYILYFQDISQSQNYLKGEQKCNFLLSLASVKLGNLYASYPEWIEGPACTYREKESISKKIRALWHILDWQKCF